MNGRLHDTSNKLDHTVSDTSNSPDGEYGVGVPGPVIDFTTSLLDRAAGSSIDDEEDGSHETESPDGASKDRSGREAADQRGNQDSADTLHCLIQALSCSKLGDCILLSEALKGGGDSAYETS